MYDTFGMLTLPLLVLVDWTLVGGIVWAVVDRKRRVLRPRLRKEDYEARLQGSDFARLVVLSEPGMEVAMVGRQKFGTSLPKGCEARMVRTLQ